MFARSSIAMLLAAVAVTACSERSITAPLSSTSARFDVGGDPNGGDGSDGVTSDGKPIGGGGGHISSCKLNSLINIYYDESSLGLGPVGHVWSLAAVKGNAGSYTATGYPGTGTAGETAAVTVLGNTFSLVSTNGPDVVQGTIDKTSLILTGTGTDGNGVGFPATSNNTVASCKGV
jgi:hypothetical protein